MLKWISSGGEGFSVMWEGEREGWRERGGKENETNLWERMGHRGGWEGNGDGK